jgi:hypothetical protein
MWIWVKYCVEIEDDLYATIFYLAASTVPKWRTFKLLRWEQLLNWLVDLAQIFYGDDDIEGDVDHSKMANV